MIIDLDNPDNNNKEKIKQIEKEIKDRALKYEHDKIFNNNFNNNSNSENILKEIDKKNKEKTQYLLRQEDREIETLSISRNALFSSRKANKLSIIAIILSVIAIIISIVLA